MSGETLKSLVVTHLRGSTKPFTLSFEKGKKLTVVYGENGTGKSTICDALDFLGKGNVGSLDRRGLGKTGKYWPSIGKSLSDVEVKLETSGGVCEAKVAKTGVVTNPPEMRPRVEVLRRSQILGLVEATPADRYGAISRFIDVSGVEASEATLRKLIGDIEKDIAVAIARVQENRDTIDRFWDQSEKTGNNSIEWATAEVSKDFSAMDGQKAAIDNLKSAFNRLKDYPAQYQALINRIKTAEMELANAETVVADLNSKAAGEFVEILEILQAAQRHFAKHPDPKACPLCESSENIDGLIGNVNERIASQVTATALKAAQAERATKAQAATSQKLRAAEFEALALADAERLTATCGDKELPAGILIPSMPLPGSVADWPDWLNQNEKLVAEWNRVSEACADNQKFVATLKSSLLALTNNSKIQKELDVVLPRLKKALEVVEGERRKFTDAVLKSIANEVGRIYEIVHPGEGMSKISLALDPGKRASLDITADFPGAGDAAPQAYFSDSHLDTLGLCVFLALAQMDKPAETILALDDVLGSVDEPHVDRLIEMLFSEASKFRQCIITTHYKPWKHKLRWGWLGNVQCHFVELTKWTAVNGISLIRSIPDVERLRILLSETPPDPQLVCAKAGVILEAVLDFLTLLYECHVPRRPESQYTLGDLLPAVDKKLRAALRVEHKQVKGDGSFDYIEKKLAPHLEEVARIAQVRNVFGCHFNALSFELLDSDAIAFGTEVLALVDCLVDHDVGWPKNSKSGSYWATTGETRRLHPLKKPS